MLITHTHWDHIQGFPFFAPFRVSGNQWDVYGPHGAGRSVRETLAGQMQYQHFPLTLEDLGASVRYHELVEGVFEIDDIRGFLDRRNAARNDAPPDPPPQH